MGIFKEAIDLIIHGSEQSHTIVTLTLAKNLIPQKQIEIPGCFSGELLCVDYQENIQFCDYISKHRDRLAKGVENLQQILLCIDPESGKITSCGQDLLEINEKDIIATSESKIRCPPKDILINFRYQKKISLGNNSDLEMDLNIVDSIYYRNPTGNGKKVFVFDHEPSPKFAKKCLYYAERCCSLKIITFLNPKISCKNCIMFRGKKMDLYSFEHNYKAGISTLYCRHGPKKLQSQFLSYERSIS
jgi:hypothetical protein